MKGAIRFGAAICGAGWLLLMLTGCMGRVGSLPADQAFALSASALSGSDSYGFAGELALYNPGGKMETRAAFEGEVSRHGNLKLNWTEPGMDAGRSREFGPGYKPLSLLEALNGRNASISYADPPTPGEPVRIRIRLNEEAAKRRIADVLREEMAEVRADKRLYAAEQARSALEAAERKLEAALDTLKVDTVVIWTADPKSWFPGRMSELTELTYSWEGKSYREKRTSETNFLAKA
ncbi:hypothetical protein B1A99_00315 [Cohnella sp. CIP 111063]|uniref:hypothetical protein n=1 Tax=unclassified Cohnella TaxID=2636738 RepID=UPI000B8C5541|nr:MULTISPECIES: hypothetical protein [unclassified Cohnella]OXS62351.1 hypothetical protein B1A99_00315 [Cohnella sp. CIP 111063]PRX74582.1 hypothetical protein B0G52_10166 [Cohnella sp. SGD-V74]